MVPLTKKLPVAASIVPGKWYCGSFHMQTHEVISYSICHQHIELFSHKRKKKEQRSWFFTSNIHAFYFSVIINSNSILQIKWTLANLGPSNQFTVVRYINSHFQVLFKPLLAYKKVITKGKENQSFHNGLPSLEQCWRETPMDVWTKMNDGKRI